MKEIKLKEITLGCLSDLSLQVVVDLCLTSKRIVFTHQVMADWLMASGSMSPSGKKLLKSKIEIDNMMPVDRIFTDSGNFHLVDFEEVVLHHDGGCCEECKHTKTVVTESITKEAVLV